MARALLSASVPPLAAAWLLREVGGQMRQAAEDCARLGVLDVARDLFRAHAQLRAAAAQLSDEEVAAAISADGSAETEVASDSAGLEISTADAAMRLGLTRERVCQLLNAGDLLGRKSGKAWRVHAPSVDDLIESRRAA
ncbi:hypothetical protein EV645_3991 [Kribbella rubisoli]|uniref:Uncharacterized protein n=1 Tax=Kribbella rubisoli TaxID=3075929 RepID=A0A4V2FY60_9ACTN|nr:hypothetical protein EV645_3991 [Kribbella rubisoli]